MTINLEDYSKNLKQLFILISSANIGKSEDEVNNALTIIDNIFLDLDRVTESEALRYDKKVLLSTQLPQIIFDALEQNNFNVEEINDAGVEFAEDFKDLIQKIASHLHQCKLSILADQEYTDEYFHSLVKPDNPKSRLMNDIQNPKKAKDRDKKAAKQAERIATLRGLIDQANGADNSGFSREDAKKVDRKEKRKTRFTTSNVGDLYLLNIYDHMHKDSFGYKFRFLHTFKTLIDKFNEIFTPLTTNIEDIISQITEMSHKAASSSSNVEKPSLIEEVANLVRDPLSNIPISNFIVSSDDQERDLDQESKEAKLLATNLVNHITKGDKYFAYYIGDKNTIKKSLTNFLANFFEENIQNIDALNNYVSDEQNLEEFSDKIESTLRDNQKIFKMMSPENHEFESSKEKKALLNSLVEYLVIESSGQENENTIGIKLRIGEHQFRAIFEAVNAKDKEVTLQ
jgi:hypothetical protein